MAESSRLEEIRGFIEMDPKNPFPRYALAMEYKNLGQPERAHEAFAELAQLHPDYVPQYLMHGGVLAGLRRLDEARAVYARGIEVARRMKNGHALGELQAALAALDGDSEDLADD